MIIIIAVSIEIPKEKGNKKVKTTEKYDIMEVSKDHQIISSERVFTMRNYSILNSNIKRGLVRFSERVSEGLTRPEFKFISQMTYGILSAQSCHLSKIARKLDEKTSLKKTIERLSRNLKEFRGGETLLSNYINRVKGCIGEQTILIIDGSNITKPCSPKMEHISRVRDGSTGKYGDGYHTLGVAALTEGRKMPICVYTRVYSVSEPGFVSEDREVLNALDFLSRHFKRGNVRAFDRGYDANIYYGRLIDTRESFVIRAKKNRDVIYKDRQVNILELAKRFKGKYSLKFKKKNGMEADCRISVVPVRLPCRPKAELNMVICNGFGQNPLMLITDLKSNDKRLAVTITKVYLLRWRIEEFYGFKKQQLDFEDFRVRSLAAIRNLDLLVTVALGYIGLISEKADERHMVSELIAISKRIYGTPRFVLYAIADGLFEAIAKSKPGIADMIRKKPKQLQLELWKPPGFECSA